MSELRELQENFQKYILDDDPYVVSQIQGIREMTAKERADCYKLDYELRLIEITEKDFPYLRQFMGEDSFKALSKAYIKAYPSNHFNIIFFDRFFTKFLEDYQGIDQVHRDLARFEWEVSSTLFAADDHQCTVDDLAAIPPEHWGEMRMTFHPSSRIFEVTTNAPTIWTAYEKQEPVPAAQMLVQPQTWMMWRFNQLAYFISLPKEREWMYHAIREGKSFAEICEGLSELMEVPEEDVAQFAVMSLRDWFLEGAIASVSI